MTRMQIIGLVLGALMLFACGQPATQSPTPTSSQPPSATAAPQSSPAASSPKPTSVVTATPAPPTADQKWADMLAKGKKEGEILIYTNLNAEAKTAVASAFTAKYGIAVNYLSLSSGSEVYSRVSTEKKAGLNLADVFIAGSSNLVMQLAADRLTAPLEPILVLPEVLDKNAWVNKQMPFSDTEKKTVIDLINSPWGGYLINTDMVKQGEITSYLDVMKPQYKGKLDMYDPSIGGAGNSLITHLAVNIWDKNRSLDFLKQLITQQDMLITRDSRLHTEWIARGKYAVALGPGSRDVAIFFAAGAPIAVAWLKEGAYTSSVGGSLSLSSTAPHPNAAAVFANWLLTKEGLTLFSKGFGHGSTRTDIPNVEDPKLLPPPDIKMFPGTVNYLQAQNEMMEPAKKVIDAANK